ncbi:MAG: biopolymer transporter ExbD [Moraxella sp.]|nr:biopolymer transporter ExbD [Moraxella sp.]
MAFSLGDGEDTGMSEMNLIPLIDIMLVLMIIFLVTATVLNPTIPLDLPKTSAQVNDMPPEVLQISIDATGDIYWDKDKITLDELSTRFAQEKSTGKDPMIHLRADKDGRYDMVAQVLAVASGAGLGKIAFVNE